MTSEGSKALFRLTRRRLLGLAAGGALLAACGDDNEDDSATGSTGESQPTATSEPKTTQTTQASTGPWEYTDARGQMIQLERPPERIVAWVTLASALYDFGVESVGIFGPSVADDGGRTPQTGRLELDGLVSLTNEYRELDLEKLAALNPDVLFIPAYSGTIWPLPQEEIDAIERIVPVVAIGINKRPASEVIEDLESLAASLAAPRVEGAADVVATARAEFDAASEALRTATAAKPDLSMIVMSLSADTVWMADWSSLADLRYFAELGVNLMPPMEELESEDWSGQLSWETVNTYETDAILLDARPQWQLAEEDRAGTWDLLPAVQAGQLGTWRAEVILSYQGVTPVVEEMAEQVNGFRPDVVDESV